MGKPTNKFDQLVQDLLDGELTHNQLQIAYRTWVRRRKEIPEEIKDTLCGAADGDSGLIGSHFALLSNTIGNLELAVRRAKG